MAERSTATTIDAYLDEQPVEVRKVLQQLRELIRACAPDATEKISYAIPTFDLNGNLVHFAGFARHVGLYPGAEGVARFADELKGYKSAKGSIQFPLDQPLPLELIRRIVEFRVVQNRAKTVRGRKRTG